VQGFRVTSPARTLVDLAARSSFGDLRASTDEFLRTGRMTLEELAARLELHTGNRGIRALADLLRERMGGEPPTESELEARCLDAIDGAGLPRPSRQKRIYAGSRLMRIDFTYEAQRVMVEADGRRHHFDAEAFERDRWRSNALIAKGWRLLRWTWRALCDDPETLCEELGAALEQSGAPFQGRLLA
jgi:very-short-patch-repair endonuclease